MTTTTRARRPAARVPGMPRAGIELRPLEPGDAAAVLAVFAGMGPRSRELRFLTGKPRLSSSDVRRLTSVDQRDHVAFLAASASDHRPVGIARFLRAEDSEDSAEVAVAVVDAWQQKGVGRLLLGALAERAIELGVRRFTLAVSDDNVAVLRLLHRFRDALSGVHVGGGIAEYSVSLEAGLL